MLAKRLRDMLKVPKRLRDLAAAKAAHDQLQELVRQQKVGRCSRCLRVFPWDQLIDETTQEEEFVICQKCLGRRMAAKQMMHVFIPRDSNFAKCFLCGDTKKGGNHPK